LVTRVSEFIATKVLIDHIGRPNAKIGQDLRDGGLDFSGLDRVKALFEAIGGLVVRPYVGALRAFNSYLVVCRLETPQKISAPPRKCRSSGRALPPIPARSTVC
jgi:hypothetical protein